MLNNPLNYRVDQPDRDIFPELGSEFSGLYILSLVVHERAERLSRSRRRFLAKLGSLVVKVGLYIKHASQPQMELRHMYVRNVSNHYSRVRHRK